MCFKQIGTSALSRLITRWHEYGLKAERKCWDYLVSGLVIAGGTILMEAFDEHNVASVVVELRIENIAAVWGYG